MSDLELLLALGLQVWPHCVVMEGSEGMYQGEEGIENRIVRDQRENDAWPGTTQTYGAAVTQARHEAGD